MNLATTLDHMAHRIAELGTGVEAARLKTIADAIRHFAPGTADALVDVHGSEISRLRAFGRAAGIAVEQLDAVGRSTLEAELNDRSRPDLAA